MRTPLWGFVPRPIRRRLGAAGSARTRHSHPPLRLSRHHPIPTAADQPNATSPSAVRTTNLRYALYCRKSTEEDECQTQSIESQKERAYTLALSTGRTITHVVAESRSAKEPGRPEFNRLLALIDADEIDGILAWHPDRLARNEMDAAALTMRLRKGVLKDLAFAEYFFHNSAEGIMMLQMALSQSQYR